MRSCMNRSQASSICYYLAAEIKVFSAFHNIIVFYLHKFECMWKGRSWLSPAAAHTHIDKQKVVWSQAASGHCLWVASSGKRFHRGLHEERRAGKLRRGVCMCSTLLLLKCHALLAWNFTLEIRDKMYALPGAKLRPGRQWRRKGGRNVPGRTKGGPRKGRHFFSGNNE